MPNVEIKNEYWEGSVIINPETISTVTRTTSGVPGAEHGLRVIFQHGGVMELDFGTKEHADTAYRQLLGQEEAREDYMRIMRCDTDTVINLRQLDEIVKISDGDEHEVHFCMQQGVRKFKSKSLDEVNRIFEMVAKVTGTTVDNSQNQDQN